MKFKYPVLFIHGTKDVKVPLAHSCYNSEVCASENRKLIIEGGERPKGGTVDACGDHRIAMLAAAAAPWCTGMVKIIGAEAVDKSYPGFWHDFASLGGDVWLEEV